MADPKNFLVIIPSPGLGHLGPSLEFAHALLARNNTFSIAILLIRPAFSTEAASSTNTSQSHPSLNFIHIPQVDPSPLISMSNPMSPEAFMSAYIELHKPNVKEAVQKLASGMSLRFVIDMFCTSMIEVADDFNSPCFTFFTSSAACLGLIHFVSTHPEFDETDDPNSTMRIQGYANPVPISVVPDFFFTKDDRHVCATHANRIREETKGVIINSFSELEEYALTSFVDDEIFPPLYPIGPLVDVKGANQVPEINEAERERIMRWLDEQEDESVVFLCFGSMGTFKADQLNEIAAGLENSQVKFLWSVRKPPQEGMYGRPEELDNPREILPEGFLARTKGQGLICGWAPQTNILAHKAVSGFVTHCGWNSILESIWFGVPTAAWPLYAEQQINAFYMVDLGLCIELKMDYRLHQEGLVSAAEIESAIKLLMSSDECGLEMRKRVKEMSEQSRAAVAEGGSSFESIGALIKKMLDE